MSNQENTNTNTTNKNPTTLLLITRLQKILSQNRTHLNFPHYIPTPSHLTRMSTLSSTHPNLYANPSLTPRSKWFNHPKWHRNSQMPPYHIHYRQEMQTVLRYLYEGYLHPRERSASVERAESLYRGSMRGLHGHVQIEENICFPLYQREFPGVDLEFLWKDHECLHGAETEVCDAFQNVRKKIEKEKVVVLEKEEIMELLEVVLDFDDLLMTHLGEEEEVVVPMSLTDKEIWF